MTMTEMTETLNTAIETLGLEPAEREALLHLVERDATSAVVVACTEEDGEELRRLARLARTAQKGRPFLECVRDEDEAARYGMLYEEVQDLLERLPR